MIIAGGQSTMPWDGILYGLGALAAVLFVLGWRSLRVVLRELRTERAREQFHLQRERLEAKFFDLAAKTGKPKGLRWVDADWDDSVRFVRERRSGHMVALVGITVRFEAIPGGGMEENPNVSNLRDATAVFNYQNGHWITEGRALFNMNPDGAIDHYHDQYEPVPAPESNR
jgi:hypothetical protein